MMKRALANSDQADGLRALMGPTPTASAGTLVLLSALPDAQQAHARARLMASQLRVGLGDRCVDFLDATGLEHDSAEAVVWIGDRPQDAQRALGLLQEVQRPYAWLLVSAVHREQGRLAAQAFAEQVSSRPQPSAIALRFLGVVPTWSERRADIALDRALTRLYGVIAEEAGHV